MAGDDGLPRNAIESAVAAAGFDLEDLAIGAGRRRVQIIVDSDDGVDLDRAAALSRDIAQILDTYGDELFAGRPYTLEVTSPGVGAPLTRPRHFRRAIGRLIAITGRDGATSRARLAKVDDDEIVVISEGKNPQARRISLDAVARVTVEVEFSAPKAAVTDLLARIAAGEDALSATRAAHEEEGTGAP